MPRPLTLFLTGVLLCPAALLTASELHTEAFTPRAMRVSVGDLPQPFATDSAKAQPEVVPVPEAAVLKAPPGFTVNLFAEVPQARWLTLTPDGQVLCASSRTDTIFLLPDADGDGVADARETFADAKNGLKLPFGMAFADGGFYVGNTNGIVRFPYKTGQKKLEGASVPIFGVPGEGYNQHWTRNVIPDGQGKGLYVSIGSETNVDAEAPPRASVLWISHDGTRQMLYASGLRNPVGLATQPGSGQLYATVNERDELGDGLVPDYFTHVQQGAFYGWPYAYLAPENLDPRRMKDGQSERPDLASQTVTPDVLFEAHSAALGLTFYHPAEDAQSPFPKPYRDGAFVVCRGSWNRSQGTGYKVVYVPFKDGQPQGDYQDFVTGFLVEPSVPKTWGRPVGIVCLPDGSLLFTEEANGRVYRVSYSGG